MNLQFVYRCFLSLSKNENIKKINKTKLRKQKQKEPEKKEKVFSGRRHARSSQDLLRHGSIC